jgi:hypothetical protein
MAKYLFVYHGGKNPESEAEVAAVMDAWGQWFGSLGAAVIDGGNPVQESNTVGAEGTLTRNGGSNPVTGYSLIEASNVEDAAEKARGCPILADGGSVEIAEAIDM